MKKEHGRGKPYDSSISSHRFGGRNPAGSAATFLLSSALLSRLVARGMNGDAARPAAPPRMSDRTEAVCSGKGKEGNPSRCMTDLPPSPIVGPKKQVTTGSPELFRAGIIASAAAPVSTPAGGTTTTAIAS